MASQSSQTNGNITALTYLSVTASGLAAGDYYAVISFNKNSGSGDGFLNMHGWNLRIRESVPTTEAVVENNTFTYQPGYRFGFNGMERDDEVKGLGKHYTTHFRQYDPRLGRWFSLDPAMAKYPGWSPYSFSFNNPIRWNDPDGDDPIKGGLKRKERRSARKYGRKLKRKVRHGMSEAQARKSIFDNNENRKWFNPSTGQSTATGRNGSFSADRLYDMSLGSKESVQETMIDNIWTPSAESNVDQLEFPTDPLNSGEAIFSQESEASANDKLSVYDQNGSHIGDVSLKGRKSKRTLQIPQGTTKVRIIHERNTRNNTRRNQAHDLLHIRYIYKKNTYKMKGKSLPPSRHSYDKKGYD